MVRPRAFPRTGSAPPLRIPDRAGAASDPGFGRDRAHLAGVVSTSVARERFSVMLLALFAGVALVLASVGVYGVISYGVS